MLTDPSPHVVRPFLAAVPDTQRSPMVTPSCTHVARSFWAALSLPIVLSLVGFASCNGGGGSSEPPPVTSETGSLHVFLRFNVASVIQACASTPGCSCTGAGNCGWVDVQVLLQGPVANSRTPFFPFGAAELADSYLDIDVGTIEDLPPGGYIVTLRRRSGFPADLSFTNTSPAMYFSLGLPASFPVTIQAGATASMLLEGTAVRVN